MQKQEAAEAEKLKQQHAAAEAQKAADQQAAAAAAEVAAKQDSAAATDQAPAAAAAAAGDLQRAHTCPTCNQPNPIPHHGYGGLARAMSIAAREAAAGGAAADAAAAAHWQQIIQKGVAASPPAAAAEASGSFDRPGVDRTPTKRSIDALRQGSFEPGGSRSFSGRHHYEVLIQNDDDPITAEAVAHTLDQYAGSSLSSKILSGHPQALQLQHQQVEQQQQQQGEVDLPRQQQQQRVVSAASLQHCATAPVHSHLLDTAADLASSAANGEATAATAAVSGPPSFAPSRSTITPPSPAPLNITGAVSRSNIELLPAQGPGLIRVSASPATAAQGLAAAAAVSPTAAAAGSGGGGAPSGWYLASGSSFKKGMWLEKLPGSPAAAAAAGPADTNLFLSPSAPSPAAAAVGAGGGPRSFSSDSAFGGVPMSPSAAAWLQSPRSQITPDRCLPDAAAAAAMSSGSFSLQLRREPTNTLPAVAEDEGHDATDSPAAAAAAGRSGGTPPGGSSGAVDPDAIRLLRRQHTTRRLGTNVLAAAGALSKALSAMTAASQTLAISNPAAAGHNPPATAAAGAGGSTGAAAATEVAGSNLLLTQDFVAAARGLSEALTALLPSAAALANVAPDQGAAAAAAASEAVQGLKDLQGQIRSAAAAAAAASPRQQQHQTGCGTPTAAAGSLGDAKESAFASHLGQFAEAAAHGIDIPAVNGHSPAAAVAAAEERRNSQSVTGCELALSPPPAACPPPVGDNISRSINLGSLFSSLGTDSFEHSLVSPSHGLGRRHSVDCSRPSFALAAAAGNARPDSPQPVLMRMPSQRKSLLSQELGRQ